MTAPPEADIVSVAWVVARLAPTIGPPMAATVFWPSVADSDAATTGLPIALIEFAACETARLAATRTDAVDAIVWLAALVASEPLTRPPAEPDMT
jgi:hypothetical protein